jgi:hypothetical protein
MKIARSETSAVCSGTSPSSPCPALGRASTIHGRVADKIVDGRDKPGHDDVWLDKLAQHLSRQLDPEGGRRGLGECA